MATSQPTPIIDLPQVDGVQFRPVSGFLGYAAGDDGSVWTCRTSQGKCKFGAWKPLKRQIGSTGYPMVSPRRDGRNHSIKVHRIILEAFVGKRPAGMECRHFPDRNPLNARLDNLSWGTPVENAADRDVHGTSMFGGRHGCAKLTDDDVREIRRRARSGEHGIALAAEYGMCKASISQIANGISWKHVKG